MIHGWNDLTILRRYQRLYKGIRKSNPAAEIGISPILPRLPDKWKGERPTREELTYLQLMNNQSTNLNWRLHEICASTPKLTFVFMPQFTSAFEYLMARDGRHQSRQGNIVLAGRFKIMCDSMKLDYLAPKSAVSDLSVNSARSYLAPKSDKAPKSVVSEMSVDSAKSIKAPKSVVSEMSVDSAKSIEVPKSDKAPKFIVS